MDVIASTAFGMRVDSQKDKNNVFVTKAKKAFSNSLTSPVTLIYRKYISFISKYISSLTYSPTHSLTHSLIYCTSIAKYAHHRTYRGNSGQGMWGVIPEKIQGCELSMLYIVVSDDTLCAVCWHILERLQCGVFPRSKKSSRLPRATIIFLNKFILDNTHVQTWYSVLPV